MLPPYRVQMVIRCTGRPVAEVTIGARRDARLPQRYGALLGFVRGPKCWLGFSCKHRWRPFRFGCRSPPAALSVGYFTGRCDVDAWADQTSASLFCAHLETAAFRLATLLRRPVYLGSNYFYPKSTVPPMDLALGSPAQLGATITLNYGDDMGYSWVNDVQIATDPGNLAHTAERRSLGSIKQSGRLFQFAITARASESRAPISLENRSLFRRALLR